MRLMPRLSLWLTSLFFAVASYAQTAPTVSLSASPTSGISPLAVTVTWSSTGATSCTASGGWSGAKATAGSEVVTVTSAATFTITCYAPDGSAVLSWTAPTENTDGSPIPATGPGSLAGFTLFHGTPDYVTSDTAVGIDVPDKNATTYTITGLPAGPRSYAARAYNAEGISSDPSGVVTNVVEVPASNTSASVSVSTKPRPPVITVETVAYEIKWTGQGIMLGRNVGTIPLGTACGPALINSWGATYYEVPYDKVELSKSPKSDTLVAVCSG